MHIKFAILELWDFQSREKIQFPSRRIPRHLKKFNFWAAGFSNTWKYLIFEPRDSRTHAKFCNLANQQLEFAKFYTIEYLMSTYIDLWLSPKKFYVIISNKELAVGIYCVFLGHLCNSWERGQEKWLFLDIFSV